MDRGSPIEKLGPTAGPTHRIPVIDKMMEVLEYVQRGAGADINDIVRSTAIPRSTVYRILNTLMAHDMVARRSDKSYALGRRILALAASIDANIPVEDIVRISQPIIDILAERTQETCKVSVLKEDRAEVVAVAQSPNDLAPVSRVGSRFMLHSGAASKLLLAHAPTSLFEQICEAELHAFNDATITDRYKLERELTHVRASGISFDRGEWNTNVHAIAAPVFGHDGAVIAALSATHFASESGSDIDQRVVVPLRAAAAELSTRFGYGG